MKGILTVCCTFISFLYSSAQDINTLIKEAIRLESVPSEKAAFQKFKEVLKQQPTHVFSLSKCSELCSRIGKREANPKLRDEYFTAARIYAETALKIDAGNADANCAMAMALGRSSMSKSGKEKVVTAREIKKYVDIALKNDPQNFKAWHILGRWHFEISNLNFLERSIAKVLYGGVPPASIKQSIYAFERSRSITPLFLLNYYEMAKAYIEHDNKTKAVSYIKLMLTLPNQTEDDPLIKERGRNLLKDLE